MSSKICSICDCGKPVHARGWCGAHYHRWQRHGDPLAGRTSEGEPVAFLRSAINDPSDECILWPFSACNGYGAVYWDGRTIRAHRVALALYDGITIPDPAIDTRHSCHTRLCINPRHLSWGSRSSNMIDMSMAGRICGQKLTKSDVLKIRRSTSTQAAIATAFNVSQSTIGRIKRRKIWAWLDD